MSIAAAASTISQCCCWLVLSVWLIVVLPGRPVLSWLHPVDVVPAAPSLVPALLPPSRFVTMNDGPHGSLCISFSWVCASLPRALAWSGGRHQRSLGSTPLFSVVLTWFGRSLRRTAPWVSPWAPPPSTLFCLPLSCLAHALRRDHQRLRSALFLLPSHKTHRQPLLPSPLDGSPVSLPTLGNLSNECNSCILSL